MKESKHVLVLACETGGGVIATIEINDKLIEFIKTAKDAYDTMEIKGVNNAIIHIPIDYLFSMDFFQINSLHRKRFEVGQEEYEFGSLEYFALSESERIEFSDGNSRIDWKIMEFNYETNIEDENTIKGFSRIFAENKHLILYNDIISFDSGLLSDKVLSASLKILELFDAYNL